MKQILYNSPYPMELIIESALDYNYSKMADLIEISGKYEMDSESENALVLQVKECQKNILSIQELAHKYWMHEKNTHQEKR